MHPNNTPRHGQNQAQPIAIFYEHLEWFKPLFAELDRRSVAYERLRADAHHFDPAERRSPYALVVNRMSPSAHTRDHTHAIPYTLQYMAHLQDIGANVLHGYDTYVYEFSKARQLDLLEGLGVRYPRARVINHPSQAPAAATGLTFPVIIKPNIGGSGAGIRRFDSMDELAAAANREMELGIDHTALVQEYLPARGNSIVRVEVLGGHYLYAIRVHLNNQATFNLCPADYCDMPENAETGEPQKLIEGYTPPAAVIETVERITAAAHIEVGGVEYLVNDRDGEIYYYDVNAMSNFVADAPNVIGFDPFPRLVDYLLARAGITESTGVAST